MVSKNEEIELTIDALGSGGEGVGTLPDGMRIFVPFALAGERVRVRVVAVRKTFAYGKVLAVVSPSAERVKPPCPIYGKCGGCCLQHLSTQGQLAHKRQVVEDALHRIGHLECTVEPCVAPSEPYGYRNKVQLPIGVDRNGRLVIGFYRTGSHDIVDTQGCALHGPWVIGLIAAVRAYAARSGARGYDELRHKGELRHVVARELDGKLLVCMVTRTDKLPSPEVLCEELDKRFSDYTLVHNVNAARTNVILGARTRTVKGTGYLETEWLGVKARVVAPSFLQVNTQTALAMYAHVSNAVGEADIVVDAYAGAGIMSAIFAKRARRVYGIEICREASEDAEFVKAQNGLDNLININGDCAEVVPSLLEELRRDEPSARITVVLDPPRKGCDGAVLAAVRAACPDRIVYVSCDPATLARDLAILSDPDRDGANYGIDTVTPYAMFPQTGHVESVVCLTRR